MWDTSLRCANLSDTFCVTLEETDKNDVVCPMQESHCGFDLQWLLPASKIVRFCNSKVKRVLHGTVQSLSPINSWGFMQRGVALFSVALAWWRKETWLRGASSVNVSNFGLLCRIWHCWRGSLARWFSPSKLWGRHAFTSLEFSILLG